jgi:hypothetical protein
VKFLEAIGQIGTFLAGVAAAITAAKLLKKRD